MKRVYPTYYPLFRCIAGACRHNCCIGWEVDVDYPSMNRYRKMKGSLGERLRASIADDGICGSIRMREDGRCPLLNDDGLCDLIIEKGERALCQICRDHPRFRLRLMGREEIGLGLCCEAACRLILDWKEPMRLLLEDDGRSKAEPNRTQAKLLSMREKLIGIAQDRSLPMHERMDRILQKDGDLDMPDQSFAQWVDVLLGLERLDEDWTELLKRRRNSKNFAVIDAVQQEQLLVYFLYRYFVMVREETPYYFGAVPFCVLSTQLILQLCEKPSDLYEVARMYSAEIEYSDENVEELIKSLDEYNGGEGE